MFSRWMSPLVFGLLIVVLGSLVGCDKFLKSDSKKVTDEVVQMKPEGFHCLEKWPDQVKSYIEDKLSTEETAKSFQCVQDSLQSFARLTKGQNEYFYLDSEIRHYFNRYLLKEHQISENFMREIMKIKVIVVGGSPTQMTRPEIDQVIEFLSVAKTEAIELRGLWKTIFFNQLAEKIDGEMLKSSLAKMKTSAEKLLENTKASDSRYEWSDFRSLLNEVNLFLGDAKLLESINKWIGIVQATKDVFIGEYSQLTTKNDWQYAMNWTLDSYFWVLRYYYQIKDLEYERPMDFQRLTDLVDIGLDIIENSPQMKKAGFLPLSALDHLIDEIWKLELFQTSISVDVAKVTYKKVLTHMFDGRQSYRSDTYEVKGLEDRHLKVIRLEYNIWKMSQMFINQVFAKRSGATQVTSVELVQDLNRYDFLRKMNELNIPIEQREMVSQSWAEWISLLKSRPTLVWTPDFKLNMSYTTTSSPQTFTGLNMINGLRTLTRMTLRGYGDERRNVWDSGITEKRLIDLEMDFRDFGREVGFLDPRQKNAASRTFKEGSFFAYHSDGDQRLSSMETLEALHMLFSGGRIITAKITELLEKNKCFTGRYDVLGKAISYDRCFKEVFKTNFGQLFSNLPNMSQEVVRFQMMYGRDPFDEFYLHLKDLSLLDQHIEGTIEYAEYRTMATVLHYIESLMVAYDQNYDGKLSEAELVNAEKRFRSFIVQMSPLKDFMAETVFLYIVYEGKKPEGLWDISSFVLKRSFGLGYVDRVGLLKVLSLLKKEATK